MPDDDARDTSLDHLPQQVREVAEETRRIKEEIRQSQQEQVEPEPSEPEVKQEEAQAQPVPETPPADEWKRKHDALFGKYSTEIGQARAKIRELESEVARLIAAASAPKAAEQAPEAKFDAGAYADYDGPIQELAATVARLEAEGRSKDALIQQLGGQMQPLQQSVAQREYETFLSGVAAQVPNLDALNADPDFLAWLSTPNPYDPAGGNFGDTLRAAESRRNVVGVARIFNDFVAQSGKYAQPKAATPEAAKPTPTRPKNVQPSVSHAAPAQPDKGQRPWTIAAIEQFYRDLAQGKFSGREDEVRAMKKEIYLAGQQGLIA